MAVATITDSVTSGRLVLNDTVHLSAIFEVASAATDPTTVTLVVTDPAGVATTYTYVGTTIAKDSTGHYSKDLAVATAGVWSYVWTGTGTAPGVEDGTFTVYAAVPSSTLLAQLDELKTRLGIAQDDTADDAALLSSLLATSGWIQGTHCEDRFCQATLTQTFVAYDRYELDIPSLVSVTTLKTDDNVDGTYETTWTSGTDYQLLPYNRNNAGETKPYDKVKVIGSKTFPITYSRAQRADLVQIVGVWGWPAIPWAVHEAALVIATDTFSLKDAKFNVAGFDTFGVVRVKQNGPALELLSGYRRNPVVFA